MSDVILSYFFFSVLSSLACTWTYAVSTEPPTDVYARPVSSTEALVWWLPVVDTGTGLQQYVEGYQVQYSILLIHLFLLSFFSRV